MTVQANLKSSPRHSVRSALMASCIAALGFAAPAHAGDVIQKFDPPGSLSTWATGINDSGAVTGYYDELIAGLGTQRGFVRAADGQIATFAPKGAGATFAESIDTDGATAGFFIDTSSGARRGFLRTVSPGNGITVFDAIYPPRPASTYAWSISNGEIAGSYTTDSMTFQGFVRHADGTIERFNPPGSVSTYAMSIKDGYVAGYYFDGTLNHCFMRHPNGAMVVIEPPGSLDAKCYSIDASRRVTGYYTHTDGNGTIGFLWAPGNKFTLFQGKNAPGSTSALSINKEKAVAGSWYDKNGGAHGLARSTGGKTTIFDPPNSTATNAVSINSEGAIAGYWEDWLGAAHGFVRLHVKPIQN